MSAAAGDRLGRPLQISVVTETYPPEVNGVAMTMAHMVAGLLEQGHAVHLVRPRQGDEAVPAPAGGLSQTLVRGLPIPRYPELKLGLPSTGTLRRLWTARRPDVVHLVTEGPLGFGALRVARRLGIPLCSDFHTRFDHYSRHYGLGPLGGAVGAYLAAFHRRTRCTFVPTRELAEFLTGAGFGRVSVIARGVDTALFDPGRRSAALRAAWGAGPQDPVALFVGRVAPEKNIPLLLEAFAGARRSFPAARLVIVGDGPLRRPLQARSPGVCFAGMRQGEDLAAHYASADLFLFPSLTETFGNVILEAMASGLAVLAFDYAAGREHIVDGHSGLLAPAGDAAAFCRLAHQAVQASATLAPMRLRAREAACRVDWASVNRRFAQALERAAAGLDPDPDQPAAP